MHTRCLDGAGCGHTARGWCEGAVAIWPGPPRDAAYGASEQGKTGGLDSAVSIHIESLYTAAEILFARGVPTLPLPRSTTANIPLPAGGVCTASGKLWRINLTHGYGLATAQHPRLQHSTPTPKHPHFAPRAVPHRLLSCVFAVVSSWLDACSSDD